MTQPWSKEEHGPVLEFFITWCKKILTISEHDKNKTNDYRLQEASVIFPQAPGRGSGLSTKLRLMD